MNRYWDSLSITSRGISIEPLIEHIKSVFRIDPLASTWISYDICNCTFVCFIVSVNWCTITVREKKSNPKSIKYMLGTGY